MTKNTEGEVLRLTKLLSSAIKFSEWKQRDIEKALGLSSGSMSRLLSGGIELKIKHIVEICEVIGFPPARFFHASYPTAEGGDSQTERIQGVLAQMHPLEEESVALPPAVPASGLQAEIERMVFDALAKFFSNLSGPQQPAPPAPPTPPEDPRRKK